MEILCNISIIYCPLLSSSKCENNESSCYKFDGYIKIIALLQKLQSNEHKGNKHNKSVPKNASNNSTVVSLYSHFYTHFYCSSCAVRFRFKLVYYDFFLILYFFLSVCMWFRIPCCDICFCNLLQPTNRRILFVVFLVFCLTEGTNIMREKSECCLCDLCASVVRVVKGVRGPSKWSEVSVWRCRTCIF